MAEPLPAAMERVLDAVVGVLVQAGFQPVLVGALAAWAWGHPRTTGDLDVVVLVAPAAEGKVQAALRSLPWPVEDVVQHDFGRRHRVLAPDLPVEVFLAPPMPLQQRELDRSVPIRFGEKTYRVLSLEDFLLRKLVNLKVRTDPNDKLDILVAVMRNRSRLDLEYLRLHCKSQRVCGLLQAYLEEADRAAEGSTAT